MNPETVPSGQPTNGEVKKRAPTLYAIIAVKLTKGLLLASLALLAYSLSDNNLPEVLDRVLQFFRIDPERHFWVTVAARLGSLNEAQVLWTAAGTLVYSLFSLVEGVGLIFRFPWAGYLAIGESAFFIPIEVFDLAKGLSAVVFCILALNILIVWYLYQNRHRLFRHHHHH